MKRWQVSNHSFCFRLVVGFCRNPPFPLTDCLCYKERKMKICVEQKQDLYCILGIESDELISMIYHKHSTIHEVTENE